VGGQRHAPAALRRERYTISFAQDTGWVPGPIWRGAENLVPAPKFHPRTVQPTASRYTGPPGVTLSNHYALKASIMEEEQK
jgi:hypothetical protein